LIAFSLNGVGPQARIALSGLFLILILAPLENLYADTSVSADPQILKLGKLIFSDRRFSASGETACSSCHRPEHGFSDRVPYSTKDDGQLTELSTPALFNMKHKIGYFSQDPVFSLAAAVERCMKTNQGASVLDIFVTLKKDSTLSSISTASFGRASAGAVFKSVAAYLETIQTSNSRYDRYMRGELIALTPAEQMGMVLFEQKGCVYCHTGKGMGGMVYIESADEDSLREVQVPRLRNLSLSAPYFSDGSAPTLADAIRRMSQKHNATAVTAQELEKIRLFLMSNESSISDFEGPVRYEYER